MSTKRSPLDVPVKEEVTTYSFQKDEHAKRLLENLAEMQANEGLLTDVVVYTGSKDYEIQFHSMLLAACSPFVKKLLVEMDSKSSDRVIVLQEMNLNLLECFKGFIYKSEVTLDRDILEDLHNFAVKYDIDSLEATCEKYKDIQVDPNHQLEIVFDDHKEVLSELFDMFLEKELTTTRLEDKKGESQFAVHGPLVAAASPVLQEVLLESSSTRDKNTFRLNMSTVTLGDLIEYIYSAKVTLQHKNAVGLFEAACTYQMPALASVCCDWLNARLDAFDKDVVSILCLARELDSDCTEELEETAKSYIIANFSKLSSEEEFSSLLYEDLKEIIQDDKLNIETEEDLFDVVMKWMECDENSRLPHLCDLLSCVRLEKTSAEFLDEVEDDPLIGKCPKCLHILDVARQKLDAAEDESRPTLEDPEEDDYDQEVTKAAFDDTSLLQFSEGEILKDCDSLSSGYVPQDYLRDSDQPRETRLRKDERPDMRFRENRELYLAEGTNKNGSPDKRLRENREDVAVPLKRDDASDMWYNGGKSVIDDTSSIQFSEGTFLECYDGLSSVSSPFYRGSLHQDCLRDSDQSRETRLRKDGQPDMRHKENRELYLAEGTNKNGSPDKRLSENRETVPGPLKKNGTPDMRYKMNREVFGHKERKAKLPSTPNNKQRAGPLKNNGTPDMRFKVNREALKSSSLRCSVYNSDSETPSVGASFPCKLPPSSGYFVGPEKKNGTPDMRYTVNKQLYGACSVTSSVPRGPLKKNGSPDMRFAANKQAYSPAPPLSMARGPLKKNGTPDMRFKANRR